jgi:predicted DNA-binding protein YlxM (UPF0122 family)
MNISEPLDNIKYYEWVKVEWKFVYKFINGYHNFFYNFLKDFDYNTREKKGYSIFEALNSSMNDSIDFKDVIKNLRLRNKIYSDILVQIENAINDSYFLEAITLEETLISNCFYNYLQAKKVKKIDTSFFKLLNSFRNNNYIKNMKISILVDNLDKWRKDRNTAIHGFIKSRTDILEKSNENFKLFSKETAKTGYELSQKVIEWYNTESINFVETEFDKT